MATRKQQFDDHAFHNTWNNFVKSIEDFEVPLEATPDTMQNVERALKTTVYLAELVKASDPDLIPPSVWQNFQTQSTNLTSQWNAFVSNRSPAHVTNVNSYLDTLLQNLSPYVISGKGAAQALGRALSSQAKLVEKLSVKLSESVEENLSIAEKANQQVVELLEQVETSNNKIRSLENSLLSDKEEESVSTRVNNLESKITDAQGTASSFLSDFLGEGEEGGMKEEINSAKEAVFAAKDLAMTQLAELETMLKELKGVHKTVFGIVDKDGEIKGGLKSEYAQRNADLNQYKMDQEGVHDEITRQMNELLGGVTTAGLASSFAEQRKKYASPIKEYDALFKWSLAGLFAVSITTLLKFTSSEGLSFALPTTFPEAVVATLVRTPIAIPIIWLSIYASKRRGENRRLEEEYAHKETIARSYNGFKEQVLSVDRDGSKELAAMLLEAAIGSAAFNASTTLDTDRSDKLPDYDQLNNIQKTVSKIKEIGS